MLISVWFCVKCVPRYCNGVLTGQQLFCLSVCTVWEPAWCFNVSTGSEVGNLPVRRLWCHLVQLKTKLKTNIAQKWLAYCMSVLLLKCHQFTTFLTNVFACLLPLNNDWHPDKRRKYCYDHPARKVLSSVTAKSEKEKKERRETIFPWDEFHSDSV